MIVIVGVIGGVMLVCSIVSLGIGSTGWYDDHLASDANKRVFRVSRNGALLGTVLFWGALIGSMLL